MKQRRDTRERILVEALALFRKRGYERTTMRDVAAACGLSLGAAYYWFPSKEAIVLSYYEHQQELHLERARAAFARETDARARVASAMHAKLDLIRRDRKLLGALFHSIGDPSSSISVFARRTAGLRKQSVGVFEEALEPEHALGPDLRRLVAQAYWALLLVVMLYFIHDASRGQSKTRRLVDGAVDATWDLVRLLATPLGEPVRARVEELLRDAGLMDW